ncbi:hypothetical protein LQ757_18775 [Agromyces sp. SYSU K20354]|uniref:hypothetical protein n=1 Tax=Agromyces cavernae TaxID=2898659 RepID=UPI001E438807|nr:hypothetical protein [Agromyces cavernae]MCD2444330.1 hypothetical protein [Agromyces cavernae]
MKAQSTLCVAAALVAVGALSACASTPGGSPASSSPPAPSSAAVLPTDLDKFATPVPDGTIDADTGEEVVQEAVATWTDADRASVRDAAETVMAAFARPDMAQEAWWSELAPMLSQQATQDYAYVQPAAVPARKVTGSAELVDDTSAYVATVAVPTDVGTYTVILSRTTGSEPWKAERITPPEGIN